MSKKSSLHLRNDSGELDVFEAAKYFEDANEVSSFAHHNNKIHHHQDPWRGGRKSLDMTISFRKSSLIHLQPELEKQRAMITNNNNKNKHKQPSSPGGKLASFLNSLFNQTKKKSKSKSGKDDGEDESLGGTRRRRRSSISHFYSIRSSGARASNTIGNNNNYSGTVSNKSNNKSFSSTYGSRTPPPCAYTPTKSYKLMNMKNSNNNNTSHDTRPYEIGTIQRRLTGKPGLHQDDDTHRSRNDQRFEEGNKLNNDVNNEDDDDGDSDTSSDLFDLPNSDLLDFYSSRDGLPVYETTKIDSIKMSSAPISTAAI